MVDSRVDDTGSAIEKIAINIEQQTDHCTDNMTWLGQPGPYSYPNVIHKLLVTKVTVSLIRMDGNIYNNFF